MDVCVCVSFLKRMRYQPLLQESLEVIIHLLGEQYINNRSTDVLSRS